MENFELLTRLGISLFNA